MLDIAFPLLNQSHALPDLGMNVSISDFELTLSKLQYILFLDVIYIISNSPLFGGTGSQTSSEKVLKPRRSATSVNIEKKWIQSKFNISLTSASLRIFSGMDDGMLAPLQEFVLTGISVIVIKTSDDNMDINFSISDLILRNCCPGTVLFRDVISHSASALNRIQGEYHISATDDTSLIVGRFLCYSRFE